MGALIDDLLLHTRESVEDDGSSATSNVVDGSLTERKGDTDGDCISGEGIKGSSHD